MTRPRQLDSHAPAGIKHSSYRQPRREQPWRGAQARGTRDRTRPARGPSISTPRAHRGESGETARLPRMRYLSSSANRRDQAPGEHVAPRRAARTPGTAFRCANFGLEEGFDVTSGRRPGSCSRGAGRAPADFEDGAGATEEQDALHVVHATPNVAPRSGQPLRPFAQASCRLRPRRSPIRPPRSETFSNRWGLR